jgi:hypothetical protein
MELPADSARCGCRFEQSAPDHHRRLVALEREPMSSLVELIEMAATWGEVEYGETEPVIAPREWIEFAETHAWSDTTRVYDALVALASLAPARSPLATVTRLPVATRAAEPVYATV